VSGGKSFGFNEAAATAAEKIARPIENRSRMDMSSTKLYGRYKPADLSFRRVGDIARVLNIGPPRVTDGAGALTVSQQLGAATTNDTNVKDFYLDITKRAAGSKVSDRGYRRLLTVVTVNSPCFDGLDNDGDGTIDLTGKDGEDRGYHYKDSVTPTKWWYDNMGPELYQFAPVNLKTASAEVIRAVLPAELKNSVRGASVLQEAAMWDLAVKICKFAQDKANAGTSVKVKSPGDILDMTDLVNGRTIKQLFTGDGVDDDNNGAVDDWAEQTWVYGYMSNWATTRSDCFAVYGTVQLRIPGGQVEGIRRFMAVMDRVPATAFRPFASRDLGTGTVHDPNKRYMNCRVLAFRWLT